MSDEPSNGELGRLIQQLRGDVRDDLTYVQRQLEKAVAQDIYTIQQQNISDRLTALETQRHEEIRQADQDRRAADAHRRQDRRLVFSALIAPVILLLLQVYIAAKGAGA